MHLKEGFGSPFLPFGLSDVYVYVYVNAKSNHHPSVIKAIPLGVNKRLNMISANEEAFKEKEL